jgi:hypothetical protein
MIDKQLEAFKLPLAPFRLHFISKLEFDVLHLTIYMVRVQLPCVMKIN